MAKFVFETIENVLIWTSKQIQITHLKGIFAFHTSAARAEQLFTH